jgi:hypothetical protein
MTFVRERAEKFDIGRVVSRTAGTIRGNLTSFYLLALVSCGAPLALVQMLRLGSLAHVEATSAFASVFSLTALLGSLVSIVANALCNSLLISGALAAFDGRPPAISDQVRTGLAVVLPVIGIQILSGIAIGASTVLLVAPGLIVACMLCVAVPAEVGERAGVLGALSRSAALTKGHRWSIFGTLILFWLALVVTGAVIALFVGPIFFGGLGKSYLTTEVRPLAYVGVIAMAFVSAAYTTVASVGLAALYAELRLVKEGPKTQSLAEVFA